MKYNTANIVEIVSNALENLDNEKIQDFKQTMSPEAFRKEFQMVTLKVPRRTGTTSAAVRLLLKYPNSIMFVSKSLQRKDIVKDHGWSAGDIHQFLYERIHVKNVEQTNAFLLRQKYQSQNKYDLMIIDWKEQFDFLQTEGLYSIMEDRAEIFVELQ